MGSPDAWGNIEHMRQPDKETYEEMVKRARDEDLPLVSQCCGADMPDYPDVDFCPRCKDHTGVEIIEEEE